jgi:ankyrin repeat protein
MSKASAALKKSADALIRAVKENEVSEARTLIKDADDESALLNTRGQQGHTPLWRAVKEGNHELVTLFLERGGDPTIRDKFSGEGNCLHVAAEYGHPELVKLFLEKGFEVDTRRDDHDETPLWLACSRGKMDCAKVLIDAGADIDAINDEGVNCYDAAREHTFLPVLALLREAGYDPGDEPLVTEEETGPRVGDIARHKNFGDGVIVGMTGFGDHLKFEVEFENHGTKKMLARFVDVLGPPQDQEDLGQAPEEAAN